MNDLNGKDKEDIKVRIKFALRKIFHPSILSFSNVINTTNADNRSCNSRQVDRTDQNVSDITESTFPDK